MQENNFFPKIPFLSDFFSWKVDARVLIIAFTQKIGEKRVNFGSFIANFKGGPPLLKQYPKAPLELNISHKFTPYIVRPKWI